MDAITLVCSVVVAVNLITCISLLRWDHNRKKEHRKLIEGYRKQWEEPFR